jgi:hypothetical protein
VPPVPVSNAVILVPCATPVPLSIMPIVSGGAPTGTELTVIVVVLIDAVQVVVNSKVSTKV